MTDPRRTWFEEQRDQALLDLTELERQVDEGEIGSATAARLQARYEAEAADAMRAIATLPPQVGSGHSRSRILIGSGVFIAAAAAATIALISAVEPRPEGGFITGGVATEVAEDGAIDLSTVTNEQLEEVIAANPDVLPMRLALARRYVEDGDFSSALAHYLFILERETNPEALMYLGWMTYLSGEAETGVALLEESLAIAPEDLVAQWFLANALYYGTGDEAAAAPLLQSVIDSGSVPAEIAAQARAMLEGSG